MKIIRYLFVVLIAVFVLFGATGPVHAATPIDLGAAANFAVLAGSAVIDANPSVIVGDVGLSPSAGSFIGIPTAEVSGSLYAVDASSPAGAGGNNPTLVNAAQVALTAAYTNASNQIPASTIPSELNGATIFPGVYNTGSGAFQNSGTVTLDAQGDPNAVFIFNAASTLTTAPGSTMVLAHGAQACNIYWRLGTSTGTIGTGSTIEGTIMADQSITDAGGSTIHGRLLARIAAVTLNNTHVTVPTCLAATASGGTRRDSTITVVKTVINDSGGTNSVADFPLFINGVRVVSGVSDNFPVPAGVYAISETSNPRYASSFSGDCDTTGHMTLASGDNKFCIITNNDIGTPLVPLVPPLISVVKVPKPLALPGGPGPVTYTYTLRNIGAVPVTNVTMVGDTCRPIVLSSGDTNGDAVLQTTETWVYHCTTTLSATHTNTVVATGRANGITATDIASATVVVGAPIDPPLIHVTKIPSPAVLTAAGGMVTYTKTVTNPGTVPLANVRLTDDKCSPVSYVSGDINGDNLLQPGEAWIYTCSARLTATTTDTVTAAGDANGLTARDLAIATVIVTSPTFPNTGFPWNEPNLVLGIILASLIAAAATALVIVLRKRVVSL